MKNRSLLLKQLFDVGDFQKLQDKISFAIDVAMITVDFTGTPISAHSGCNDFCKRVRENPDLREHCQKCDSRGGIEAARISKPYIYMCHMGLVDFAIPIFHHGIFVGSVLAGQIRLKNFDNQLERVTSLQNEKNLEGALLSLYNSIPAMSLKRIEALSDMIFYLYNYVIKEAAAKIDYEESLPEIMETLREGDDHKNAHTIKKAVSYINENYTKEIRLAHLATLCDLSPSYFSKLFKKIYQMNLSTYTNSLRIEKAKALLVRTDRPIVNIAYDVGFEDCGYFIKTFKKFVDLTPSAFRASMK